MASAFTKDVIRSVTHSWGRFIAIAIIAALGTGFFAGLRMTGPDMRLAGTSITTALPFDARVVSTVALTITRSIDSRGQGRGCRYARLRDRCDFRC